MVGGGGKVREMGAGLCFRRFGDGQDAEVEGWMAFGMELTCWRAAMEDGWPGCGVGGLSGGCDYGSCGCLWRWICSCWYLGQRRRESDNLDCHLFGVFMNRCLYVCMSEEGQCRGVGV